MNCPDPDLLACYAARTLAAPARATLYAHLAACPSCRECLQLLHHAWPRRRPSPWLLALPATLLLFLLYPKHLSPPEPSPFRISLTPQNSPTLIRLARLTYTPSPAHRLVLETQIGERWIAFPARFPTRLPN